MKWFLLSIVLWLLQPAHAQEDAPPAYPRAGAIKLLENPYVIVWDIAWLQETYPLHRHRYDHVGVYYASGDRIITSVEGEKREVSTQAWNISFQRSGVMHTETGNSEEPLRAVFIQIKRPPGEGSVPEDSLPLFPVDTPLERLRNDRVIVWEYNRGAKDSEVLLHRHTHDTVVIWFDSDLEPTVHYVPQESVHSTDLPASADRAFVFEIR